MAAGTPYEISLKGDINRIKLFLDKDEELLTRADSDGRMLIHWAALGGHEGLAAFLLDLGSPVDPTDDTLTTPLLLAASAGKFETVRLFISRGANVNHYNNRKQTCLHYACSKGYREIVILLLGNDAYPNVSDTFLATPLHRAASQGRTHIVHLLIESKKLRINEKDSTGNTPLHLACEEEREDVATLLVQSGADLSVKNKEEKAPLDLCSPKLAKILRELVAT